MVDAAGYSVIARLLPAISQSTDAGPSMIGVLVASFPAGMLIGFWAAGEMLTRGRCGWCSQSRSESWRRVVLSSSRPTI
jgi:MFS family permease